MGHGNGLYALTIDGKVWKYELILWEDNTGKISKTAWVEFKPSMFISSDGTRTTL